jgi:monothiol glutaredoxin
MPQQTAFSHSSILSFIFNGKQHLLLVVNLTMTLLLRSSVWVIVMYTTLLTSFAAQAVAFCPLIPGAIRHVHSSSASASASVASASQLASSSMNVPIEDASPDRQRIQALVDTHNLLMFMNGSQARPGCEKSDDAAKCLERVCGSGTVRKNGTMRDENLFQMIDITSDGSIRKGLQEYNPDWDAAIPQLYANGEFVGGSDTMYKMFYNGDFKRLVDSLEA